MFGKSDDICMPSEIETKPSNIPEYNNLEMLMVNVSVNSEETLKDGFSNIEKVDRKRNSYLAGK